MFLEQDTIPNIGGFVTQPIWIPAAAISSYLAEQDFTNGSGSTPGAPTSGGSWTNSSGTWSFSNTSPSLPQGGNNAKGGPTFGGGICYGTFTSGATRYGYFQLQLASIPASTRKLVKFRSSGSADVVWVSVLSDGRLGIFNSNFEGYATVATISGGTNYHVWFKYDDTGNTQNVAFNTTGTRPTSGNNFASGSNSVTTAVEQVALEFSADNIAFYYDRILVSDTQIGDNP